MARFKPRASGAGSDHSTNCGTTYCGQSYKHFTLVNYESRVVPDWKIPHIMTLES